MNPTPVADVRAVAALLLVANTIQVAAYSKRREVAVMKLVGATNWCPHPADLDVTRVRGTKNSWLTLIDKGEVTAYRSPEVRALASR